MWRQHWTRFRALRVAARFADSWNTWGGTDIPVDQFLEVTVSRSRRLDRFCEEIGRDPATLRRSLLVYPLFVDAWAGEGVAEDLVGQFRAEGFTELVFAWPSEHQMPVSDHSVQHAQPQDWMKASRSGLITSA